MAELFTWQNRTDLGEYIHIYNETQGNYKTQGNYETQALSTENCLLQVQEDRRITIKEEGSKEDDGQEGADSLIPRLPGKSSERV